MAMEISGTYGNYAAMNRTLSANEKNQAAENGRTAEGSRTDQTGKAAGGAKPADKVADYYNSLQKKFDCVKNGNVAISGIYLKECANDPEKAKELEENLSFFKESYENGYKNAKSYVESLGGRLINYSESWSIDAKGNITMIAQTQATTDPGTKDAKELAKERKKHLEEKKEKERIDEKRKEKKEEQEKIREKAGEHMEDKMQITEEEDSVYRPKIDLSV